MANYCTGCGKELQEGAASCDTCGTPAADDMRAAGVDLYWGKKTPVIGSIIVVKQLVLVFGAGILFVFAILALADPASALGAAPALAGIFIFFIVLALLIAAAIQFFTRGGPYVEFAVTREGIGYRAGDESRALNTATLVGGALGGSLTATGGSLVNITREMDFMGWDEIRSATAYRRDRSVLLYRKALIAPFAIYCIPENFEKVVSLVRERAPQAIVRVKNW